MKYVDEFRDSASARKLLDAIRRRVTRPWTLMEVCGGQTHSLLRNGIVSELAGLIELIHGPGCPVCVTPAEAIDFAQQLALADGVTVASFGDMLRVPGSSKSLLDIQALGGSIKPVYSPMDAVNRARKHPTEQIVFFAVGFETTAPATALAVQQAYCDRIENFSLLVSHVRVQPAMEAIARRSDNRVEAFLAAGHVCTIAGFESYESFVSEYKLPVVVTGFEPIDLLEGILACVHQLESERYEVENQYARSARRQGNAAALGILYDVYEVCDKPWRGFGEITSGGLRLREKYRSFDARKRFAGVYEKANLSAGLSILEAANQCRSADVLAGRIKPTECPAFGKHCTPDAPLGAPMVSSEGACAAYFTYRRSPVPLK